MVEDPSALTPPSDLISNPIKSNT